MAKFKRLTNTLVKTLEKLINAGDVGTITGVKFQVIPKSENGGFPSLPLLQVWREDDEGNALWRSTDRNPLGAKYISPSMAAAIASTPALLDAILEFSVMYTERTSARRGKSLSDKELLRSAFAKKAEGKRLTAAETNALQAFVASQVEAK